jgi:collagenase-like PrtC family protease
LRSCIDDADTIYDEIEEIIADIKTETFEGRMKSFTKTSDVIQSLIKAMDKCQVDQGLSKKL